MIPSIDYSLQSNTAGFGEIARIVASHYDDAKYHQVATMTYGEPYNIMFNQLYDIFSNCSNEDWDGYGAAPVSSGLLGITRSFILSIPTGFPTPEVNAETDGDIGFEWYKNPNHILSVSINSNCIIYYAALIGERSLHGKEFFDGVFPQSIFKIVNEVFSV